ncbi:MAG: hypothetical protein WC198_09235 [Victivallaceae bacterium]
MSASKKTIVRAQYNGKAGYWRIMKKTTSGAGGWAVFSSGNGNRFDRREAAEAAVDVLCDMYSDTYKKG